MIAFAFSEAFRAYQLRAPCTALKVLRISSRPEWRQRAERRVQAIRVSNATAKPTRPPPRPALIDALEPSSTIDPCASPGATIAEAKSPRLESLPGWGGMPLPVDANGNSVHLCSWVFFSCLLSSLLNSWVHIAPITKETQWLPPLLALSEVLRPHVRKKRMAALYYILLILHIIVQLLH